MVLPGEADWAESVYHLYVIRTSRRNALRAFLRDREIEPGSTIPSRAISSLPWGISHR